MSLEEKYEKKYCKGCKWYNYPTCKGTITDGLEMDITKLRKGFRCGIKDREVPVITTTTSKKSELELQIEALEATITAINERLSKIEEALKIPKV